MSGYKVTNATTDFANFHGHKQIKRNDVVLAHSTKSPNALGACLGKPTHTLSPLHHLICSFKCLFKKKKKRFEKLNFLTWDR